jgi:Na+/melibiose symporter-like transporter
VTLVFFAMFGCLFFLSQYLQFVLGYSALKAGASLLPIAVVLMVVSPISAKLVGRSGTKIVVTAGLTLAAIGLLVFATVKVDSGYGLVAAVLIILGAGMALAMAPATDSIMGVVAA